MKFVTLTSVLGLSVGLAAAAPFTPKAAENVAVAREALFFDLTYIDKRVAEAEAVKSVDREAQSFDLTYIDKREAEAEAEAAPQVFDLTYIDKRDAKAEPEAEAAPQFFDLTYIDKA